METLKRVSLVLCQVFAVLFLVLIVLSILNHLVVFSANSVIAGFDYLPPLWLLILALPVCLAFFLLHRRRTALGLFTLILLFFCLFDDFSFRFLSAKPTGEATEYEKLSVVTFNVRYYSHGIEKLVNYFKQSQADVILLSESVLNEQNTVYLQNSMTEYILMSDSRNDTAILSRFPVISYDVVYLPSYLASLSGGNDLEKLGQTGEHRAFVHAVIDVNGAPVNVLSVRLIAGRAKDKSIKENLKWGRYLLQTQEVEQKAILDYMRPLNGPIVFGGDLNAPPSSRVIKNFRKIARDAYHSDHFFGNFTFRTDLPSMRLDYIFHSPEIVPVESKIIRVELSDHFPVKCDFLIPKTSALAFK